MIIRKKQEHRSFFPKYCNSVLVAEQAPKKNPILSDGKIIATQKMLSRIFAAPTFHRIGWDSFIVAQYKGEIMMKKSLKKMIICFFMMVGIMGAVAVPTEAKSHVNYTKIYKKFAKKQVKKKKKNLYMAVVKLDTPVLLITDHVWDGTVNMAHLYQYHKKKVRYIGYIGAGGTGTKLSYHKKYLVYGGHHFSCRVRVKNGVGRIDTSAGIYLNNVPYYHEKAIIKHNKKRIISKKRISKRQAEKDDYYAKCHSIKFKKVK